VEEEAIVGCRPRQPALGRLSGPRRHPLLRLPCRSWPVARPLAVPLIAPFSHGVPCNVRLNS
jgi:hypothetical protein